MTHEVRLREVTEADLPVFFEHQRDPVANRMAAFPPRERDAFMTLWARIMREGITQTRTILCDGQVAGMLVCFERSGERLVGYWIGQEYWGRGVATRALSEFLAQVKERPLTARVAKHNIGSLRVLERCGFTVTGEDHGPSDVVGEEVDEFILTLSAKAPPA